MFTVNEVRPGVCHIKDAMGVCFTLIAGEKRALLFDAGYGTEDVSAFVKTLTDKPLTVLLSHGHHDHMLGARWFPETFLCAADLEEFRLRSGREQRTKVMRQAAERGVEVPADFLGAPVVEPRPYDFPDKLGPFSCRKEDLGGREVLAVHVPGHTAGSIVLFVPDEALLLTGDDWNPCTWVFFPCSEPVRTWRSNMLTLIRDLESESGEEIRNVLCSHQPMLREGSELKAYLAYMTDERLRDAPVVQPGPPYDICEIRKDPEDWTLAFDPAK